MNLFHAAMVLAGWPLMVPTGPEEAPLSKWRQPPQRGV